MVIRDAREGDQLAVARLTDLAFAGPDESALIARLRDDGDVLIELVAEDAGEIVGHILFSPLPVERDGATAEAAALAPMAVLPGRQRSGVGSALVKAGLDACRAKGVPAVVVLGHPDYYPRFGFTAEAAATLQAPFSGPAFMALELTPGALEHGGRVRYAKAFGL
ncbi:N-acetyltransferase [Caulobacter sp. 17J65-9]|uniref:GNAT family N-acetyltransferase n=1 Tax=Caulobacter sp. 17J65-9 TaxID=2709382 RepID=UPI0013C5DE8A|nr:N-acetyltransferase [Caulobacter sp. 17J65-9]